MPKDEFDFQDPFELNGMVLSTEEDTTDAMCECFVEEFIRLGYTPDRILALFRNPFYLGMNLVIRRRGESFVRDQISQTFARWGRPVAWPDRSTGENLVPSNPEADGSRVATSEAAGQTPSVNLQTSEKPQTPNLQNPGMAARATLESEAWSFSGVCGLEFEVSSGTQSLHHSNTPPTSAS